MSPNNTPIVITAYFYGSGYSDKSDCTTTYLRFSTETSESQIVKTYPGVMYTHGFLRGFAFGAGTEENAQDLVNEAMSHIKAGKKVILNAYGFSRGAVGAILAAKWLGAVDEQFLEVNLVLLDPTPGNSYLAAKLDVFNWTLANKAMDLSQSRNLKRVLSYYMTGSVPFLMPLYPTYPYYTEHTERVKIGIHDDLERIEYLNGDVHYGVNTFLKSCGTKFGPLPELNRGGSRHNNKTRSTHSKVGATILKETQTIQLEEKLNVNQPKPQLDENDINLYRAFLRELSLTAQRSSLNSKKAEILQQLNSQANAIQQFDTLERLKNSLRIVLALALQRQSNRYGLSTSTTGNKALTLLRQPRFQKLAQIVLGYHSPEIRYQDLRLFVLGENEKRYFNSCHQNFLFKLFEDGASAPVSQTQLSFCVPIENTFNEAKRLAETLAFQKAIEDLKIKTRESLLDGSINEEKAKGLAQSVISLATSLDVPAFEAQTSEFSKKPGWSMLLAIVIGAAIGALVGAMLGIWAGPTAAVTAFLGLKTGALIGAAIGGASGVTLSKHIGMWAMKKSDPVQQVALAAQATLKA